MVCDAVTPTGTTTVEGSVHVHSPSSSSSSSEDSSVDGKNDASVHSATLLGLLLACPRFPRRPRASSFICTISAIRCSMMPSTCMMLPSVIPVAATFSNVASSLQPTCTNATRQRVSTRWRRGGRWAPCVGPVPSVPHLLERRQQPGLDRFDGLDSLVVLVVVPARLLLCGADLALQRREDLVAVLACLAPLALGLAQLLLHVSDLHLQVLRLLLTSNSKRSTVPRSAGVELRKLGHGTR